MRRTALLAIALPVLVGVISGCGNAGSEKSSSASATTGAGFGASGGLASGAGSGASAAGTIPSASPAAAPVPAVRQVVSTATISLQLDDITAALAKATQFVTAAGGFVGTQHAEFGERPTGTVTLRVPPERFDQVVDQLSGLGKLVDRQIQRDDVTKQVADLDGRIAGMETSTERLRFLLGKAGSTGDIVAIEHELSQRETDLESLLGQRKVLGDQIGLATITVTMGPLPVVVAAPPKVHHHIPGVSAGLRAGADAMLAIGRGLALGLAFAAPFAPVFVLAYLAWRVRRWRLSRA